MTSNGDGVKHDEEKLRLDLIPVETYQALGEVLGFGAKKYGEYNWSKGMAYSRLYGATLRHLVAWWDGESKDPESNKSHLWHALANIAFLIAYEKRGIGTNDKPGKLGTSGFSRTATLTGGTFICK